MIIQMMAVIRKIFLIKQLKFNLNGCWQEIERTVEFSKQIRLRVTCAFRMLQSWNSLHRSWRFNWLLNLISCAQDCISQIVRSREKTNISVVWFMRFLLFLNVLSFFGIHCILTKFIFWYLQRIQTILSNELLVH